MRKIYLYAALAWLTGGGNAFAQNANGLLKMPEKECAGMTLSRFTPDQKGEEGRDALSRYPLLRKVHTDQPRTAGITEARRSLVERRSATASPARLHDMLRAASGREMWANVTYSNTWESYDLRGYYAFNSASSPFAMQMLGTSGNYYMEGNGGAVIQDGVLYIVRWSSYGSYFYIYVNTFDTETFQQLGSVSTKDVSLIALETATNMATGVNYGVFYNSDATGFVLGSVDYATLNRKDFGTLQHPYVALGVTKDDTLYGVATDGNLYKINKETCEETLIGNTGVQVLMSDGGHYGQSGEIDQKTGVFYWVAKDADKNTALYTVDLNTGAATKLTDLPGQETVFGLYLPPEPADDNAPAAVTDLEALFDGNSLEGIVTFQTPTTTYGGGALSGSLDYYVMLGNDTLVSGKTQPGATVEEEVIVPEEGMTTFRVATANSVGSSPESKVKTYVGNDEPAQVQNVRLAIDAETGKVKLTWDPVTAGVNSGYVGNITYNVVRYPDSTQVASGLTAPQFEETLPADKALQAYSYEVEAVNGTQTGKSSLSNRGVFGAAITPPYNEPLDQESSLDLYTIIDNNQDGSTWAYNEREGCASYIYNRANDGDDWLITPAIQLKGGKLYSLSFETCGYGYDYLERIEVRYGNQPTAEAMTHTLLDTVDVASPDYIKYTREIAADKDQKVFIGFHAVSPANEYRLYLKNVALYEGLSLTLADSVKNLRLTADADAQLLVNGSFKTPSHTLGGDTLGHKMTRIDVLRGTTLIKTFEHPDTATVLTFTDNQPVNGFNAYSVKVYTAEGEGRTITDKVYVGIDTPRYPQQPSLTDQTSSIRMSWKPVGKMGANGGVVKPEEVWYKVYDVVQTSDGVMAQLLDSVQGTSYDISFDTNKGDQTVAQYGLAAASKAGTSLIVGSAPLVVGKPYALPFRESLTRQNVSYFWWGDRTGNSSFTITNENSADNDGGCFALKTAAPEETAWINSGKIALGGVDNPKLRFSHYADPRSDMKLTVEIQKPDGTVDSLYRFDYKTLGEGDADQWRRESVSLKAYASLPYIIVRFRGDIGGKAYTLYLDDIEIDHVYAHDLKAAIAAPEQLRKGNSGTVRVTVTNKGDHAEAPYIVKLLAADETVAADTVTTALQPMESRTLSFDYKSSLFAEGDQIELKAVVENDGETYAADNTALATVRLQTPEQAKPEAVTAENAGHGSVKVDWNAPAVETSVVNDDMENYTSWSTDAFGGWTSVFGQPKGGAGQIYSSVAYPHQGEQFGYIAFDPYAWSQELTDQNPSLVPHSGGKYLASFYSYREQDGNVTYYDGNDWLISPALSGEAQTVSFWVNNVKAGGSDFPETFEVLCSTAGTDTLSFVKTGEKYTVSGGQWQQVSVALPAGTTHFAIRHCTPADKAFVFMVDDVSYVSGNGSLKGYNIYRDGELVAFVDASLTDYTVENVPDGDHVYAVTAVYAEGESAPTFSQTVTTGIASLQAVPGRAFTVYTVDGVLVGRGFTSLSQLKKGTYVINDKTVIVK